MEIYKLINDIKVNQDKYLYELNKNIYKIREDMEVLNQSFNGIFNYSYLTNDFYKMVVDKIKKFDEAIDSMKLYVHNTVNKEGCYDPIVHDNNNLESNVKQKLDNILNYQLSDKEDKFAKKSKSATLNRLAMYFNTGLTGVKLKKMLNKDSNLNLGMNNDDNTLQKIYVSPEKVKLNKDPLQKYFAYIIYNTIRNNFKYKKPKSPDNNDLYDEDLDIDVAKPIPGTNEMLLYDKKTTSLTRKFVEFDKKKHKYLYFLNGCRSVLIKDILYIFGGVDQEKNPTKVAYVYYIKTNELKIMPEMLKPHAYHAVEFLDYYKSIIVVGGENSNACEIYDLNTGIWRKLPNMNVPKAHCNLYLDKFTHIIYTFFGVVGDITERHNYTDIIECLELKRLSLGWNFVDYKNKAEMDFKSGYNKILPLSGQMILIYGATNMRDFVKKAAVYLLHKFEIVKIDNNIFKEIKEKSKYSRKLAKVLSSYI